MTHGNTLSSLQDSVASSGFAHGVITRNHDCNGSGLPEEGLVKGLPERQKCFTKAHESRCMIAA